MLPIILAMPPILSIVGKSNSGKTTLLEKLIPELRRRGYRVGVVKHHAHADFEFDVPGKDTWRMAQAGAEAVAIASPGKIGLVRCVEREPSLDEVVALFADGVDIVLTEGYKWAGKPKIEVSRAARSTTLICDPSELLAIVADHPLDLPLPQFGLDDITSLADLIERYLLQTSR